MNQLLWSTRIHRQITFTKNNWGLWNCLKAMIFMTNLNSYIHPGDSWSYMWECFRNCGKERHLMNHNSVRRIALATLGLVNIKGTKKNIDKAETYGQSDSQYKYRPSQQGAAETVSCCIIHKQMASASSYRICLFLIVIGLSQSSTAFGLAQLKLIYVQHM